MSKRQIFSGPVAELIAVLAPHVVKSDWLRMSGKVEGRVQKQQRLIRLGALVGDLSKLQENLAFTPRVLKAALYVILESAAWKSSLASAEVWVTTHQQQLAKDLRSICQARNKSKPAKWISALARARKQIFPGPGSSSTDPAAPPAAAEEAIDCTMDEEEGEEEEPVDPSPTGEDPDDEPAFEMKDAKVAKPAPADSSQAEVAKPAPADSSQAAVVAAPTSPAAEKLNYVFGWSADSGLAWRAQLARGRTLPKEFTSNIWYDENGRMESPIVAVWHDGVMQEIDEMPVGVYLSRLPKNQLQPRSPPRSASASSPPQESAQEGTMKRPAAAPTTAKESKKAKAVIDSGILPSGKQAAIAFLKDKQMLIRLTIGKSPMLYIRQDKEGSEDIMRQILSKLIAGEVQEDKIELRKLRDSLCKPAGPDARPSASPEPAEAEVPSTEDPAALPSITALSNFARFDTFMGGCPS